MQYPNHYVQGGGGVEPTKDAATALFDALSKDQPISLTGDTGVGSVADPNAPATQAPATASTVAPSTGAPSTGAPATGAPTGSGGTVDLPSSVHGQTANQYTCSKPFSG